jgi:hypothetical protein
MPSRSLKYLILASPFLLTACGEGWEMIRTDQFPYGNIRTAGTGVAYVRAKMLPQKELKLESTESVVTTPPPPAQTPMPSGPTAAEKTFREQQTK